MSLIQSYLFTEMITIPAAPQSSLPYSLSHVTLLRIFVVPKNQFLTRFSNIICKVVPAAAGHRDIGLRKVKPL